MQDATFIDIKCKKAKPTKNHRPAIWGGILGTVYAMNSQRQVEYFDYDYAAAKNFAGITDESDARVYRNIPPVYNWTKDGRNNPSVNQSVLWVKK